MDASNGLRHRPAAPQPVTVQSAAETKADSSRPQLDVESAAAADAILDTVEDYVSSEIHDVRDGLNARLRNLKPDQVTAVLEANGKKWLVMLLKSEFPLGGQDFLDLCSELIRQRRFTGDLLKLFGGVVPALLESKSDASGLRQFVSYITSSTALSAMQKEEIIWGTRHQLNPALAGGGHWAAAARDANYIAQAALLSGIVGGASDDRSAAANLLPADLETHVRELSDRLNETEYGAFARQIFLTTVEKYVRESAPQPCCALL